MGVNHGPWEPTKVLGSQPRPLGADWCPWESNNQGSWESNNHHHSINWNLAFRHPLEFDRYIINSTWTQSHIWRHIRQMSWNRAGERSLQEGLKIPLKGRQIGEIMDFLHTLSKYIVHIKMFDDTQVQSNSIFRCRSISQ